MSSANRKLAEARILACKLVPYARAGIMALVPVEQPGLGTMAMDGFGRLYYDEVFLAARELKDLAVIVIHEWLHFHCRHARRQVAYTGGNPQRLAAWRKGVDCSVNEIIADSGLNVPEDGCTAQRCGLGPIKNQTPEQYSDLLLPKQEEEQKQHPTPPKAKQEEEKQEAADPEADNPGKYDDDSDDAGADDSQEGEEASDGESQVSEDNPGSDREEAGEEGGEESPGDGDPGEDGAGEDGDDLGDGEGESSQAGDEAEEDTDDCDHGNADGPSQPGGDRDDAGSGDADSTDAGPGQGSGPREDSFAGAAELGGSVADGIPRPWELGPPSDEHPGLEEHEQNLIEAAVATAIERHARGGGHVGGALAKLAGDLLHRPVDPVKELRSLVKYAIDTMAGFGDYSYSRASNRSQPGGCILPTAVRPIPRVTVIVDTSGSMQAADMALAMETIANALRGLPDPRGLRVLVGGTRVEAAKNVFRKESVVLLEGGGTDIEAIMREAAEERPAPKALLVVTDGETCWGSAPVHQNVIIALTRKPRYMPLPPDHYKSVLLNPS